MGTAGSSSSKSIGTANEMHQDQKATSAAAVEMGGFATCLLFQLIHRPVRMGDARAEGTEVGRAPATPQSHPKAGGRCSGAKAGCPSAAGEIAIRRNLQMSCRSEAREMTYETACAPDTGGGESSHTGRVV